MDKLFMETCQSRSIFCAVGKSLQHKVKCCNLIFYFIYLLGKCQVYTNENLKKKGKKSRCEIAFIKHSQNTQIMDNSLMIKTKKLYKIDLVLVCM